VLACLREESETPAALIRSRRFAINVLHRSQSELSDRFARRAAAATWDAEPLLFCGGAYHAIGEPVPAPTGLPADRHRRDAERRLLAPARDRRARPGRT